MKKLSLYNSERRIEYIDLARGIAIILVLFGHMAIISDSPYNSVFSIPHNIVYSFHIPLFFFLTGICFSDKPIRFGAFLKKKARGLLVPYFSFASIWYLYEVIIAVFINKHTITLSFLCGKALSFLLQKRLLPIWFLTCLFLVEVLFYIILNIAKKNKAVCLSLSLVVTAAGIAYHYLIGKILVWNLDIALLMVIFTCTGYCFKSYNIKKLKKQYYLLLAIVLFVCNQFVNHLNIKYFSPHVVDIFCDYYCNIALFYVAAFLGIGAVVAFSIYFADNFSFIKYIGQNSLIIFALHQILFRICETFLLQYSFSLQVLYMIWVTIVLASIVLFMALTYFVINTPLCILIGKKFERKRK